MNLLELFAGSRSVGVAAEEMGFNVFSTDFKNFDGISLQKDVLMIEKSDIPFYPDVIWASPPCTTYSIAAISHHRNGTIPKSEDAKNADKILSKTLEIISWFPDCTYYIENPVGMMRKMPQLINFPRTTVTYCKYGDTRMKPTDIWSNNIRSLFNSYGWQPRSKCYNGNKKCRHEPSPRGSKTGTQGLANDFERSKIPQELIIEILKSTINEKAA